MSTHTKTKKIRIADLQPGHKIKSWCTTTNSVVFNEVTNVWNTTVLPEDQVSLMFSNGAVLDCSKNHPIMINENGKTVSKFPEQLTTTDEIISDTGTVTLASIVVGCDRSSDHIDISVAGSELFFAQSPASADDMILVHNCNQGGVRGGAATVYFTFWHLEFEDLIVLKNNKGTEENRARHMDYGVQFNKLAYERLLTGGNLTLFSPSDVPKLYDAFFQDQNKFVSLYEAAERNPKIRKKTLKAIDLFTTFMQERKNTGRIYIMNVDHANTHSSFIETVAPIKQSNLCLTGDSIIDVLSVDGTIHHITLEHFVEQFQLGNMTTAAVRSYNVNTRKAVWSEVSAAAKTATVTTLIEIEDEHGNKIRCTPDHQIFTKNRGYVIAKDLLEADTLCTES